MKACESENGEMCPLELTCLLFLPIVGVHISAIYIYIYMYEWVASFKSFILGVSFFFFGDFVSAILRKSAGSPFSFIASC